MCVWNGSALLLERALVPEPTLLALIGTHIGLAGGTVVLRVAGTVRAVQAQGAGPAAAEGGESEGS